MPYSRCRRPPTRKLNLQKVFGNTVQWRKKQFINGGALYFFEWKSIRRVQLNKPSLFNSLERWGGGPTLSYATAVCCIYKFIIHHAVNFFPQEIQHNYRDVAGACLTGMLEHWLTKTDPPSSWSSLIEALRSPVLGRRDIASEMETRITTNTTPR